MEFWSRCLKPLWNRDGIVPFLCKEICPFFDFLLPSVIYCLSHSFWFFGGLFFCKKKLWLKFTLMKHYLRLRRCNYSKYSIHPHIYTLFKILDPSPYIYFIQNTRSILIYIHRSTMASTIIYPHYLVKYVIFES